MNSMKCISIAAFSVCTAFAALVHAEEANPLALSLSGSVFKGVYIRAGTPYTLQFGADGGLTDSAGRSGRWWVQDSQHYCRIWQDGPMAGVETCMEVVIHNQRIAIYSENDKVLEGELIRP